MRLIFLVMLAALVQPQVALSQSLPDLKPDRVEIEYVAPRTPAHRAIHKMLMERRVLESFKQFLSPLRLPRTLTLKVSGCKGEANAWYENDAITVCYEYIDEIMKNAPKKTTPEGVSRADAILGPIVDVFLHETGHAVFDYLEIPVLGREEDAADQFSAYILLKFGKSDAPRLIAGVAYAYSLDAGRTVLDKTDFADVHGLSMQRFYNVLCMAYGSDPKLFAKLMKKKYLPRDRAEGCDLEYLQVTRAVERLIVPYLDKELALSVAEKQWLSFDIK